MELALQAVREQLGDTELYSEANRQTLADLLKRGEADHLAKPEEFRRYGSARKLYTFNIDNASAY